MQEGFSWSVRLFIDQPRLIDALAPHTDTLIQVFPWEAANSVQPAEVVIEAFGCDPPSIYVTGMVNKKSPPVWINLEYFSAEQFALDCHGLPSPQHNGLNKYFFFPGVAAQSGGLLTSDEDDPTFTDLSFMQDVAKDATICLLFCYPHAPIEQFIADLHSTVQPVLLLVADGGVANHLLGTTDSRKIGSVTLQRLDFLPQTTFDHLLAGCDLAFVRGEDSLARALLAGVPHVWNIYAQTNDTHLLKLNAFLDWFLEKAEPELALLNRQIHDAWNRGYWPKGSLSHILTALPALSTHAKSIRTKLRREPDLGTRLSEFVLKKLNC